MTQKNESGKGNGMYSGGRLGYTEAEREVALSRLKQAALSNKDTFFRFMDTSAMVLDDDEIEILKRVEIAVLKDS
ncbi:MAG: hypothetical protein ACYDEV_04235 [Acidiferrobacter sp.]